MRFILLALTAAFSMTAFAELDVRTLTCSLQYQIPTSEGSIKYVTPKNGDKQVRLTDIKICNDNGCRIKRVAAFFLGSNQTGGASIRVLGDKTTIIVRDAAGNRFAMVVHTAALVPREDGPAVMILNADGFYEGELISGIVFSCMLVP
jgi:hypothetical protein